MHSTTSYWAWAHQYMYIIADDFRSAMHQANSYIKSLFFLSRQGVSSNSLLSPPSSAVSPSSTSPNPPAADETELNRARVDTMNLLIGVLQRNLRVRYELDIAEIVHA